MVLWSASLQWPAERSVNVEKNCTLCTVELPGVVALPGATAVEAVHSDPWYLND
jgi:hypothetical protein